MTFAQIRCVMIAASVAAGLAEGQQPEAPPDSGAVIKTETRLVLVDAVVTDKKGEYIRDLTAKEFHVWEDSKEQAIKNFSFEADPASPGSNQPRYLVLLFDNSTMNPGDQARAREAAAKFIDTNTGPNHLISIVNFTGSLQVAQNFTENAERLKSVVNGIKISSVSANEPVSTGMPQLGRAEADFAAHDLIMALRSLAKTLGTVPGRKTLVLLTAGFPVRTEQISEVTATIDACNRANVAIYPIDVRGLVSGAPIASVLPAGITSQLGVLLMPALHLDAIAFFQRGGGPGTGTGTTGGSSTGGGRVGGGAPAGGNPGGGAPGGGRGGVAAPVGGRAGGPGNTAGAPGGGRGAAPGGGMPAPYGMPGQLNPYNQSRLLIPKFPESTAVNQQVMYMLADGTGGFVIHETNDLLGGLQKIGRDQNEYYSLGYTPPESEEGSCHILKVKVTRGGATVRARTGYCYAKPRDLLQGNPIEKTMESRAASTSKGKLDAAMQIPFFYTSPNVARVNLAMEIEPEAFKFEKQKGKFHAEVNVLGIAYTPEGKVGARFSDMIKVEFADKKDVERFNENSVHYENQFEVASGTYNLKVVFGGGGENFGKLEMPLVVGPYQARDFGLSGLALSKEARAASNLDLSLDASLIEDRTPLLVGNMQVVPSGSQVFKIGDPAMFYFEIYEPMLVSPDPQKQTAVGVQMRVLDRKTGQQKSDTGVMRVDLPADKAGNPVIPVGYKIPVTGLSPGSYVLELHAMDTAGQQTQRSADFDLE